MTKESIDRRKLLPVVIPDHRDYLFVSGLAGAARDTAALTDDGDHLFALGGIMGAAVTIGLGIAMSATDRKIMVVTGDGELLMNIGALVTVASAAPENLSIVCIDNGRHGETGNQPGHTSRSADIEAMARGAGFKSAMTVATPAALPDAARFLKDTPGPRLLVAKVLPTSPTKYSRLMDPAGCRLRFRNAFLSAG